MLNSCIVSSKNIVLVLIAVKRYSHSAKLDARSGEHTVFRVLVECRNAAVVVACVHCVE